MENLKEYYICTENEQGDSFGVGEIHTIEEWKEIAINWCENDGKNELKEYIKKLDKDNTINEIQEIWQLQIEVLPYLTIGIMREIEYVNDEILEEDNRKQLDTLDLYKIALQSLDGDAYYWNAELEDLVLDYNG